MQCIKNNMRKGEGAQFFLHEISIKQRKWRVLYLVLHSRGFFKKFSTPHVIHCKKMCGLSVPSQDVKHSLNYYIIFGPGSA
jgi:hypothetical protein